MGFEDGDDDDGFQDNIDTKNDDVGDVAAFLKNKKKTENAAKKASKGAVAKKPTSKKK